MNILMLEWDSFAHEYIIEEFLRAGCELELFPIPFGKESMRDNEPFYHKLKSKLKECAYDFVFCYFIPNIQYWIPIIFIFLTNLYIRILKHMV